MRLAFLIATFALTTAAATAAELSAQRVDAWVRSPYATAPVNPELTGPFAALIARRTELGLSGDQVNRIRTIQRGLMRDMEPLEAQIRDAEVFGVSTAQDSAAHAAAEAARREKVSTAEQGVAELLTPEQREQAAALAPGGRLLLAYPAPEEPEPGTEEAEEEPEARAPERRITIRVENLNYYNATVYVYNGAQRQRLGDVTGLMSRTFTLPRNLMNAASGLRFEVRLLARSSSRLSNTVLASPGDEVYVRIAPS